MDEYDGYDNLLEYLINVIIDFMKQPLIYSGYEFSLWDVSIFIIVVGGICFVVKESFFND